MKYRKILANIFVALLTPIIVLARWLPNVYNAIVFQHYEYYNFRINSLKEYLYTVYGETYLFLPFFTLVLIFLPFQWIKDYHRKNKIKLSFAKKCGILASVAGAWILLWGCFTNIWVVPWYHNFIYIVYASVFGLFFSTILYLLIDRYEK